VGLAARFRKVLVPELNTGQLKHYLRGAVGIDGVGLSKVKGKPFHVVEVRDAIVRLAKEARS
jgi:2-oxoglutarate ferredoxin oxidoreductase subunit alpha